MQGPEIWLVQLGINVTCVVDPSQPAILDEAHRVFVNYETYYLSSTEARQEFQKSPWRYTDLVTDPVSQARFQPAAQTPSAEFDQRLFYFSSDESAETFAQDPGAYATPVVPYAGRM